MTLIMSDKDPRYQIDVILEEARRKKQERLKNTLAPANELNEKPAAPILKPAAMRPRFTTPETAAAPIAETTDTAAIKVETPQADTPHAAASGIAVPKPSAAKIAVSAATVVTPKAETAIARPIAVETPKPIKTPVGIKAPGSAEQNKKATLLWAAGRTIKKPAEDVKIYIPKASNSVPEKDTIVFDNKIPTKINTAVKADNAPFDGSTQDDSEEDLEQIRIDDLPELKKNPASESKENAVPDRDLEEQVKIDRKKKAENFHLHGPAAFKLSGEEEENEPGEEPDVFEDEELEDFGSYEEADAVRSELTYRRRIGLATLILTMLITVALTGLTVALYILKLSALNPVLFIGLNIFLLGFASLLNHRIIGDGLNALFHLRATADSAAGLTTLAVLLHTLIQILNLSAVADGEAVILAPAAALGLFFSALGKQMRMQRICDNFQFVSYRGDKYAAKIVDDERMADEIGRTAVDIGVPIVCYAEKAKFLSHFLENSYQTDSGDRAMRRYLPFILIGTTVVALIYGFFTHDIMNAFTVFAASICLSSRFGVAAATNFPFLRAAKRVLRHGAMMVGPQTVGEFGEIHALAVDALDLFPSESVLLHGIKTFSGSRIDEAILDAAAVSFAAGGPLSSVFRRVIQNRVDILKKVDTLVYEQDMGMSGWVGGRRVLVGNRKLLENHGVDVPSRDYESRYTKNGRQIVYLSTAGELSAMFVVSYTADEGIAKALDVMTSAGITLLVNTCDPNITEELICREYNLDSYYVEIMGAPAGRCYERLTSEDSEQSDAVMATNGRLEGMAFGITYCRRLHRAFPLAIAIQIIGGALGFALSALLSLYTNIFLPPLFILAYLTLWIILSWLLPTVHRV